MNVDKFGHYIHKRLRLSEIFEFNDNALLKSESGEFDLKSSILKGVRSPLDADEAANKEYVDQFRKKIIQELNKLMATLRSKIIMDAHNTYEINLKASISEILSHLNKEFYSKTDINKLFELNKSV